MIGKVAASVLVAGLAGAGAAWAVDGTVGLWGALIGLGIAVVVLGGGLVVVDRVATLVPALSLLIALMTYGLQLLLVFVVLAALEDLPSADETWSKGWLAGMLIAATLVWTVASVALHKRSRVPLFEDRTANES